MKVLTVVGARPQFVKHAVVSHAMGERAGEIQEITVHTGQHFDAEMSDIFFTELAIPEPKYHLGVSGGGHGAMTGRMLEEIELVLLEERPDWVLVYGDTNSTLAGAIAAAKLSIPVAHVESGLRSFDRAMPEEINRILTDQCSTLLFTPCTAARTQLLNEGVPEQRISNVGDVMYDATLFYRQKAAGRGELLQNLGLQPDSYVLVTVHRAANTDSEERLRTIVDGLLRLSQDLPVILPLHPRTRAALTKFGLLEPLESAVKLLPPQSYLDMLLLQNHAKAIVTDSGGVQKEAFFLDKPCVVLRDQSEWRELIEMGSHQLMRVGKDDFIQVFRTALNCVRSSDQHPYGEGDAARRIVSELIARGADV